MMDAKIGAEATASQQIAQGKDEQARLQQEIADLRAETSRLNTSISQLQSERGNLINDKITAMNRAESIAGQTATAMETSKTQALLIQQYRDEVTKLREAELGYKRREIELTDRINDLASASDVKDASIRSLQEQLVEANRTIQSGGNSTRIGAAGPYTPSFPVSATVVSTDKDPATGKPIAKINVGTNNQIQKDMKLTISRGGNWLADLVITRADLGWAEGMVEYYGRTGKDAQAVQPGDRVSSLASR
jgi:hypothetical protein